jgi:hypothetical protein
MKKKKGQTVEYNQKIKRLERLHAKWKERQRLDKRLELEELLMDEPDGLDLEMRRYEKN